MGSKPKVALYWAASCGGCEITVLDIAEHLLGVAAAVDLVFWPVALDFKYQDLEAMEDKSIDLCLFNGAIRSTENRLMAERLRARSKLLIAFGSCSCMGGIPSLANLTTSDQISQWVYADAFSCEPANGRRPTERHLADEGVLTLPRLFNTIRTLDQTVDVDYYLPGCPPESGQVWRVLQAVLSGELPPRGSVVGASEKTLCEECERTKEEKKLRRFFSLAEKTPDPDRCLLEQGIVCCGPATRGGCGARCIKANMPCRGCYGAPPGVIDQGAKLASAISSVLEADEPGAVDAALATMRDPVGTFYRFGVAASLLRRARV
jgi:F420-non-reducing hydrogenase small subunit